MKGNIPVIDTKGNKDYYSPEAVETMKESLKDDGKKGFVYDKGTLKDFDNEIDQRRGFPDADKAPQRNAPTTTTASPAKTDTNTPNKVMSSNLNSDTSIAQPEVKPKPISGKPNSLISEDVKDLESANRVKENISSVSDVDAGKEKLKTDLANHRATLDLATPEGIEQAKAINKAALAKEVLAAGAMDRSERFAVGKHSINAVRDIETGGARIEATKSNKYTDGDEVNHNYGMSIKNPVQFAAHETGAFDTTRMGTDDASILDNAGGAGWTALATYGAGALGYKAIDHASGGGVTNAVEAGKHKIKGDVGGSDAHGNTVYFSKEKWESLENDGLASKNSDGKWETSLNRNELKEKFNDQKSLSAGKDQNFQAAMDKNPNTNAPIKNPSIKAPSNIYSPKSGIDMSKYNTKTANTNMKNALNAMSDREIGKNMLLGEAKEAQKTVVSVLEDVSKTGDVEKKKEKWNPL